MNANTFWIKSLLLSCTLLFAFANSSDILAATKLKSKNPEQIQATIKTPSAPYQVQDYQGKGLNIQFRYEKNKLKNMRIMNTMPYTVRVDALDNRYILGAGDYIVIDPPTISYVRIKQTKLYGDETMSDILFPDRFTYYMTFKLPQHHENKKVTIAE